jgi:hypothetical protein
MLIYGGVTAVEGVELGDMWEIDLSSSTPRWTELMVLGPSPAARADMMATHLGTLGMWIVHGGNRNGSEILNDTWVFDTTALEWVQIAADGPPVAGAHSHG